MTPGNKKSQHEKTATRSPPVPPMASSAQIRLSPFVSRI